MHTSDFTERGLEILPSDANIMKTTEAEQPTPNTPHPKLLLGLTLSPEHSASPRIHFRQSPRRNATQLPQGKPELWKLKGNAGFWNLSNQISYYSISNVVKGLLSVHIKQEEVLTSIFLGSRCWKNERNLEPVILNKSLTIWLEETDFSHPKSDNCFILTLWAGHAIRHWG